jgi:hypothetical protein
LAATGWRTAGVCGKGKDLTVGSRVAAGYGTDPKDDVLGCARTEP